MNKVIARSFSSLILAVVLGWAPSLLAQQKGTFSLDRFQPSLPGIDSSESKAGIPADIFCRG